MPRKSSFFLYCLFLATALAPLCVHAQTASESVIYSYTQTPQSGLIQALDGNFYGVNATADSIYKLTPAGVYSTVYQFTGKTDGEGPVGITQGPDGNFYGVTSGGGSYLECGTTEKPAGCGTFFKVTPAGTLTTFYNFCDPEYCPASQPNSNLVLGSDGNFYGTTATWQVFKVTPSGILSILYDLTTGIYNVYTGEPTGDILQASDGNFYLTTSGQTTAGTLVQITPAGFATILTSAFCNSDCTAGQPSTPEIGLIQGTDGDLYGTSSGGTASGDGSASGMMTTLVTFCSVDCVGDVPPGGLVQAGDGNYYGLAGDAVFQLTPAGAVNAIYGFNEDYTSQGGLNYYVDGFGPYGALLPAGNGELYGTTLYGGIGVVDAGAAYAISLSPALPAPIQLKLSASSVEVGTKVTVDWSTANAVSTTAQQCYGFETNNNFTTNLGQEKGTYSSTTFVYSGSFSFTPIADGTYQLAVTCGGTESGFATLTATGGLAATSTVLTTNSPVLTGAVVKLTATVTPRAAGSVVFEGDGVTLGTVALSNGSASLSLPATNIPAGTYQISATYSGNSSYQASVGDANFIVNPYSTASSLSVAPLTVQQDGTLTLSSTVSRTNGSGMPTGTTTFTISPDGEYAAPLEGSVNATLVNGKSSLSFEPGPGHVTPGQYSVTAVYDGDGLDSGSDTSIQTFTLLANTTTGLVALGQTSSQVTLSAEVRRIDTSGIPTGSVSFYSGTIFLGTAVISEVSPYEAQLTESTTSVPAGKYPVTAVYSGDSLDAPSTSSAITITVQ